ncbi:hypothetical protein JCM11491_007163 [Sporobolomyces phaffii]
MPPRPSNALPELFLTFLAPSLRPSLTRISSSPRHHSTLRQPSKDLSDDLQPVRMAERSGREGPGGRRAMSKLATHRATERREPEVYVPVASTSAVRLDSLVLSPSLPTCPPPSFETPAASLATPLVDDADRNLSELPLVLRRLQSLSLSHPTESPSQIIARARSKAFDDGRNRAPPTPPPPIVLHPQPYSSNSQFFTPLLLQAMILGASALGLLTRRKVRSKDGSRMEEARCSGRTAREQAEERIDELQALNLLISAHAIPEAVEHEERKIHAWRDEMLKPLVNLVAQAVQSDRPLNRLGIASVLHYATPSLPTSLKYEQARPLLAMQAYETYQSLPPLDRASPEFPLEVSILSSLLALVYPRQHESAPKLFPSSAGGSGLDRSILESVANRLLGSPSEFPPELVLQLGTTAARAKRLDIFEAVVSRSECLSASLRIDLAVTGLDLVASRQAWRNDREKVLPLAELFASTVKQTTSLDSGGLDRLDRGIYLLRTAFSIDRPLEPFISRAILATLSNPIHLAHKRYRMLLSESLNHVSKSRNPSLARQILSSIPSENLRLSCLSPLLESSHAPTSQFAWDLLLSHPSLPLTASAVSHRFTSLSHRSAVSSTLEVARRDFRLVQGRGVTPTVEIWNKLLHVVVRFGTDRAVERVVASIARADIEPNEWTRTILLQREMIRRDEQVRVVRDGTREDERERPTSQRPVVEVARVKRRGGGQAQMRKLREAMRAHEGRERETTRGTVDITPNLLLKNFTRWTTECDVTRLVQLTKVVVGVELGSVSGGSNGAVAPFASPSREPRQSSRADPVTALSTEEYEKVRVPAFRTLISAFERRGRIDFAQELRRASTEERSAAAARKRHSRRALHSP